MKRLVIYHGIGCADGFTSAWCAHLKYGDDAEYLPMQHNDPLPDVTGRDVLMLDISFSRAAMLAMRAAARSLLVLDHHRTAHVELAGLKFAVFDMSRSGAGMAWDELFPGEERPALVNYVEDRDLWRWALPNSREVNAFIGVHDHTFSNWFVLRNRIDLELKSVAMAGKAVLLGVDAYVRSMLPLARSMRVDGQDRVAVVNAPGMHASELLGKLAEDAPFAVGWIQRASGRYSYSLRSRRDFDVSAFALRMGGGGHKNAAGFEAAVGPDELFGKDR